MSTFTRPRILPCIRSMNVLTPVQQGIWGMLPGKPKKTLLLSNKAIWRGFWWPEFQKQLWLVVWNMFYFPQELGWSNLTNSIIFQRGRSTTNQSWLIKKPAVSSSKVVSWAINTWRKRMPRKYPLVNGVFFLPWLVTAWAISDSWDAFPKNVRSICEEWSGAAVFLMFLWTRQTCSHLFSQNWMVSISFAEIKVSVVDAIVGGPFHQQVTKVVSTPSIFLENIKACSRLNTARMVLVLSEFWLYTVFYII